MRTDQVSRKRRQQARQWQSFLQSSIFNVPNDERKDNFKLSGTSTKCIFQLWKRTKVLQLTYLAKIEFCYRLEQNNTMDPRAYGAKYPYKSDLDMLAFLQAMNGKHAKEYVKAMKLEVATLIQQNTWKYVLRQLSQHVLKGTWAFKLKRLLDGTAYRFKARYCARRGMQETELISRHSKYMHLWLPGARFA